MYGYKIKGGKQGLFNRKDARVRANTKRNAKEDWEKWRRITKYSKTI